MRKIVLNRIKTPDGTVLTSYHRHDFKTHEDTNGNKYGVDGGLDYLKRIGSTDYEEMSVYSDEPHQIVRECLYRGTRGKDGTEPLTWVALKDMSDQHIKATIEYEEKMEPFKAIDIRWYLSILKTELWYRNRYDNEAVRNSDDQDDGSNGDKISENVSSGTTP